MNNNDLISLVIKTILVAFIPLLLLYHLYRKIRSKFDAKVNCWFCNQNTKVPYAHWNSWTCPHCEQYNGFTKDGDYNREILEQFDCSNLSANRLDISDHLSDLFGAASSPSNGFCDACTEAQRLKIERLSQFEPKREYTYDAELKVYKTQLEEQYRLCATCERHLKKVLSEKKKMVLGSKFFDYIVKKTDILRYSYLSQMRQTKQQQWKRRLTLLITSLALINLICLLWKSPVLTRENFTHLLGETLGHQLFIANAQLVALVRVFASYLEGVDQNEQLVRLGLYCRTLFMMLMYALGLKIPQIVRLNFVSIYTFVCPFAILALALGHNVVDKFRLTRFTFVVMLWSTFAGGLIELQYLLSPNAFMFIASLLTFLLSFTNTTATTLKQQDETASSSFHKMYSDMSDDDNASVLSQERNLNNSSMSHSSLNHSYRTSTPQRLNQSLLSSSRLTLGNNPSFSSQYATPLYNYSANSQPRSPIYGSSDFVYGCRTRRRGAALNSYSNSLLTIDHRTQSRLNHPISNNQHFLRSTPTAPFASPLVFKRQNDNRAAYQHGSYNNLLSASRLPTNFLSSNASSASWHTGGYLQQCQMAQPTARTQHINFMFEPQKVNTAMDDNSSHGSSQSSGFESQNSPIEVSRENLLGPDASELFQRDLPFGASRGFKPIVSDRNVFPPRPSRLLNQNFNRPLSVNCAPTSYAASACWDADTSLKTAAGYDLFNLRKMNDVLPPIKRGDLLRKWKEGQKQVS